MHSSWEEILQKYRAQQFHVFLQEDLLSTPVDTLINGLSIPSATYHFLHNLSHAPLSLWESFVKSVRHVHKDIQEESFPPLKVLLTRATKVAILYGEHVTWKSPNQWSYLFEGTMPENNEATYSVLCHTPATLDHIRQAETMIGMALPPSYVRFLKWTNGFGFDSEERRFVCGVGDARARWEVVTRFQPLTFLEYDYHEITSYWLQWQDTLAYERERDKETGYNTFRSDERICVPFAYTYDDWCFDRSHQHETNEYPVLFWDHETREATETSANFEAWFANETKSTLLS